MRTFTVKAAPSKSDKAWAVWEGNKQWFPSTATDDKQEAINQAATWTAKSHIEAAFKQMMKIKGEWHMMTDVGHEALKLIDRVTSEGIECGELDEMDAGGWKC